MSQYQVTFVEAVGVCILIIGYLLYKAITHGNPKTKCTLIHMYILLILVQTTDIIWILTDGNPDFIIMNYIINGVYLFLFTAAGYFWFNYCEKHYSFRIYKNKLSYVLLLIPVAAIFILTILSPILEEINGQEGIIYGFYRSGPHCGQYYRGSLHFLQSLSVYGYIFVSAVLSIVSLISAKTYRQKNQFIAQSVFNIIPIACAILQVMSAPGTLATHLGATLALIIVYISTQDQLVTRDPLTDLPNRYSLDKILTDLTNKYKDNPAGLYLLMLDIDNFKAINDEYGHIAGDAVLKSTAKLLQEESEGIKAHVARLAGDEFVMVLESGDYSLVEKLTNEIRDKLRNTPDLEYKISISIGAARYDGKASALEFLNQADTELYVYKKAKNIKK